MGQPCASIHPPQTMQHVEHFPDNFYVSHDVLPILLVGKDHLWSKAHVRNKDNTVQHTSSSGKINVKGKKKEKKEEEEAEFGKIITSAVNSDIKKHV